MGVGVEVSFTFGTASFEHMVSLGLSHADVDCHTSSEPNRFENLSHFLTHCFDDIDCSLLRSCRVPASSAMSLRMCCAAVSKRPGGSTGNIGAEIIISLLIAECFWYIRRRREPRGSFGNFLLKKAAPQFPVPSLVMSDGLQELPAAGPGCV